MKPWEMNWGEANTAASPKPWEMDWAEPEAQPQAKPWEMDWGGEQTGTASTESPPARRPRGLDMEKVRAETPPPSSTIPVDGAAEADRAWANTPFPDRVLNPLTAGVLSLKQGVAGLGADMSARSLAVMDRVDRGEAVPEMDDPVGYQQMTPEQRAAARRQAEADIGQSTGAMVQTGRRIADIPQNPAAQRMMGTKSWGDAASAFWSDPLGVIGSVGLQSLPTTAPAMVAGVVGGPAAGVMAMGASSAGTEYLSSVIDGLGQEGVDVGNEQALMQAFRNPELMARVRDHAAARASIIAPMDAATMGLAGKTLVPKAIKNQLVREALNVPAQIAAQGTAGGAAEAGAQIATEGRITSPGQILGEMVGEAFGAPAEVAALRGHAAAHPVEVAPPNVTPADVASPIPTDLISHGRSIVDDLLAPKPVPSMEPVPNVADLPQGAVPAEVLLGQVAEPEPVAAPAAPAEAAPHQPAPDAATPAGLQPLYDEETDQQVGWFDPQTGRTRPLEQPIAPEVDTAPQPAPDQAAPVDRMAEPSGSVAPAPMPAESPTSVATLQSTTEPVEKIDVTPPANDVNPVGPREESAPTLEAQGEPAAAPQPILTKAGTPFTTEKSASLAARQRPDLKGQALEPVQVEGGWGLRPVAQTEQTQTDFVQPKAQAQQGVPGAVGETAPSVPEVVQSPASPRDLGPPLPPRQTRINDAARSPAILEASIRRADETRNRPRQTSEQRKASEAAKGETLRQFDEAAASGVPEWRARSNAERDSRSGAVRPQEWERGYFSPQEMEFRTGWNDALAGRPSIDPEHPDAYRKGVLEARAWMEQNPRPDGADTVNITARTSRGQETRYSLPADADAIRTVRGNIEKLPVDRFSKARTGDFVRAPDGSPNFGEIGADAAAAIGRQPGVIRLREGDAASGLAHIRERHTEDAQQRGYDSVEAMIADVARNYDEIHKGRGRALILVKRDGRQSGAAWIQLEPSVDGDFYDVKTATPSRMDFMGKQEPAWKRSARRDDTGSNGGVATSPAPFSARAQAGDQNISDPETRNNSSEDGGDAFRLVPAFEQALPDIGTDLAARLQRYGIADRIGLKLVDVIRDRDTDELLDAVGRYGYGRRVIEVALNSNSRTFTLDHEVIHGLRDLDLIRPAEWTALRRAVIQDRARMADVRARYPEFTRWGDRPEATDRLIEEAIADLFAEWQAGRVQAKGFVRTAMERIRDFLRAVGQTLRGLGFRTPDSVFRAIDRGEIGARDREEAASAGGLAEAHHAQMQPRDEQGRFVPDDRLSVERPAGDKTPGTSLFGRPQESIGDILRDSSLPLLGRIREASSARAIGESVDRWRANFQDRYLPLLRSQQAIERVTGAPLDEAVNPYLGEELSAGRVGAQLEDLSETMIRPLFQDMHRRGVTVEELESYLYARHAPERNARIAEINPKFKPGEGSGMTDGEAEAIMKVAARLGKKEALEALAARVDAILKFALDTREKAGLLSAEEAKAWRANYEHYVPLRGHEELDSETNADRPRKPRGVSVTGKESQRAFGRESRAADILAYSVMQAEEAIIRAETNRVARQFYDLAKANPAPGFWKADKVAMRPYWSKAKQQVEFRAESRVLAEDKDFTVTAKIDGVEHRVVLDRTNPDAVRLAESMRNLKGEKINAILQTFGAVNRYLSTVSTSLNPEFVITNAFRDLQTAAINLNQHEVDGIISGTLKDYPAALKASMKGAFKKGSGDWAKWYDEFRSEGGRVYFNSLDDINAQRAKIEREMKDAAGLHPMKAIRGIFGFIEKANLGVENAVRLAAYKNAREGGLSKARAASLAKNLTVNFNRRGHYGPLMNSLYLFYNASVQGTAVLLGAMKHRRVQITLGAAVLTGAMMEMLNMALTGADDDGEDYYGKISDFEKSRNLIVMNPWGENGSYFKLPLPYGYNAFYHLGRSAVELGNGKPVGKTLGNLLTTLVDSFNPVGGSESLLKLISPTISDPLVDLSQNRDFAGKPIKPEQPQYGAKKPESQMYWGSVSPVSKAITDFMNEATGGDKVRSGKIDVSPEALDYLFGVATGAAGTFYGRAGNALLKLADPDAELAANDIPVYRKMVGEKPAWYDRTMAYERIKAVEQLWSERQAYAKAGENQKAREVDSEVRGLAGLRAIATETRQELSEISKERTASLLSHEAGRISDGGFRLKTKALETREKGILDRFNRRYRMSLEPQAIF